MQSGRTLVRDFLCLARPVTVFSPSLVYAIPKMRPFTKLHYVIHDRGGCLRGLVRNIFKPLLKL